MKNETHSAIYPILKDVEVNIQHEKGNIWGGLENVFSERELSKEIYTVTVSIYNAIDTSDQTDIYKYFFDESGEDDQCLMSAAHEIEEFFGFEYGNRAKELSARCDKVNNDYWFTNKNRATQFAKDLSFYLDYHGYSVKINQN